MEATVILSRKERRKAQATSDSLPVVVSDAPENIEAVDAVEPTTELKTAPTASLPLAPGGSLPTAPIAITTGSLPISMVSRSAPIHEGVSLTDDDDVDGSPKKYRRFIYEIMDQENVSLEKAEEIYQKELEADDPELAASLKAEAEQARIRQEAEEAEEAETIRVANAKREKAIRDAGAADLISKQAKRRMLVSLVVGLILIIGFFLMGGF